MSRILFNRVWPPRTSTRGMRVPALFIRGNLPMSEFFLLAIGLFGVFIGVLESIRGDIKR